MQLKNNNNERMRRERTIKSITRDWGEFLRGQQLLFISILEADLCSRKVTNIVCWLSR